jgi:undecaprenyl pyrophosphate phosphatase UppP
MPLVYVVAALIIVLAAARLCNMYIPMSDSFKAIFNIVLMLIAVGMLLWVVNTYIPMAGGIKALLNIVVFVAACVGVLQAVGLWDSTLRLWSKFRIRRTEQPAREAVAEAQPRRY